MGKAANVFRGIAHTLEAVTSECSNFQKQWTSNPDSSGLVPCFWEGEWRSDTNQHHGSLRCVLLPRDSGHFQAFFRAKYSRFLRACYKVNLIAKKEKDLLQLSGSADLGALAGGEYHYQGTIAGGEFTCRYKCRYDEGKFYLKAVHRSGSV